MLYSIRDQPRSESMRRIYMRGDRTDKAANELSVPLCQSQKPLRAHAT